MSGELMTMISRRSWLQASVVGPIGAAVWQAAAIAGPQSMARGADVSHVKALVFDVFGTVVDWRSSVAREIQALARRKKFTIDGATFADAWRAGYGPSMNRVRSGELPWTRLDDLHRMTLERIVRDFGLPALTADEMDDLNRAWHRLDPWPDTVAGLTRLKKRFTIAPLSNGNIALMTDLARHSHLPWDVVLGAELVHHYKPDHEVYESAADFLSLPRGAVMMVAAHLGDLRAAKAAGLSTAFVTRPLEFGEHGKPDRQADATVDVSATDFNDLARQLGS